MDNKFNDLFNKSLLSSLKLNLMISDYYAVVNFNREQKFLVNKL